VVARAFRCFFIDFIDVDDVVDDASEEKVVISEQLLDFVCLITLIKVAFVVFPSGHPLFVRRQNRFLVLMFFKEEIIQASAVARMIFQNLFLDNSQLFVYVLTRMHTQTN